MSEIGPNMKKLIIRKMSNDAVPDGGGLQDGINFLRGDIGAAFRKAEKEVREMIQIAMDAGYPGSEEDAAGEVLKKIYEKENP